MKWLSLSLLPLLAGIGYFVLRSEQIAALQEKAAALEQRVKAADTESMKNSSVRSLLQQADRKYLEEKLETVVFLEPEIKRLQTLSLHRKDPETLLQRLDFLRSGKNKMVFVEGERRQTSDLQETEEKLQHPVEINDEDLKKLLVLIEGAAIHPYSSVQGRPQLVVKEFDLSKKKASSDEEVYVIDLELVKRELL